MTGMARLQFSDFFGIPIIAIQPRNPEFQISTAEFLTIHFVNFVFQNTSDKLHHHYYT